MRITLYNAAKYKQWVLADLYRQSTEVLSWTFATGFTIARSAIACNKLFLATTRRTGVVVSL